MAVFDRFRRVLVVLELDADVEETLRVAERFSPTVERVHCLCLPDVQDALDQVEGHGPQAVARLRAALADWQTRCPRLVVSYTFAAPLHSASVARAAEQLDAELVVVSPLRAHTPRDRASVILRMSARHGLHVLSVGSGVRARPVGAPLGHVLLTMDEDAAALPALARFVSELPKNVKISAVVPSASEVRRQELGVMFEAQQPTHPVAVHALDASVTSLAEAIDAAALRLAADLVVGAVDAASGLEALAFGWLAGAALQQATCLVWVLPRTREVPIYLRERLVASDALLCPRAEPCASTLAPGQDARVAVERMGTFGRVALGPQDTVSVVELGIGHPPLGHDDGVVSLPRAWFGDESCEHRLLFETTTPVHECAAARVFKPERSLILLDATLDGLPVESLLGPAQRHRLVFVRLRRSDGLEQLRERLSVYREVLGLPYLIDASAWLNDAGAEDVPSVVDGQRLLRVALRVMASGLRVHAVVTRQQHLRTQACHALTEKEWPHYDWEQAPEPAAARALSMCVGSAREQDEQALMRELDLCTQSVRTSGHSVQLVVDNRAARRTVLALIANAKVRVHWQCYIVEDDAITAEFGAALAEAAARGVEVRFLADAVYSMHDAFGRTNSFLTHLATAAGVEVRTYRPVTGLPNLSALKRRNHRKCIVIDGETAVITGRNLGAPYYRGFQEAQLTPLSPYRDVPWLDCGATLKGPLVGELERSFAHDWQRAGGEAYPLRPSVVTSGASDARLVLHDGLRDTHTFDAQLALIRHARRELVVVNNFPLVVELQRELLAAIRRGVRVRVLFGSVRPHFADDVPFPGGTIRSVADQLVRSRLDPLVAAGADVRVYAVPALPEWDPRLARVFPHVHAKLLMRDQTDVAVGSANLDVTAAYWESEVLLIVHDATFACDVQREVDALFATSRSIDRDSESYRSDAAQRSWLSRYWPSLIG